jgi:hypothetical protein
MHSCGVFLWRITPRTVLFQILLTTFGFGLNFIASFAGIQLMPFMLNPIFESSSPSDFWGRRWNMVGKCVSRCSLVRNVEKEANPLLMISFLCSPWIFEEGRLQAS